MKFKKDNNKNHEISSLRIIKNIQSISPKVSVKKMEVLELCIQHEGNHFKQHY